MLLVPTDLVDLLVPRLLSAEEERFGSRVSICAEEISPTSADRSDGRQSLLRTAVPRFRFRSARVCDQVEPALRLRELPPCETQTLVQRHEDDLTHVLLRRKHKLPEQRSNKKAPLNHG